MIKNIKIAIVEDEVLIAEFIHEMLLDEKYKNIQLAHDCKTALALFEDFVPDIILLDINVEGKDTGIELAKKKNPEAKIIYITAQQDEATLLKAIATNPENYLTKPIKKTDVIAAVKLVALKSNKPYIQIKDGFKVIKIMHDDIYYIKSEGNYIDVYTQNKKYALRQSLTVFFQELNSDTFSKIHRSYIVNIQKITAKSATSVTINDTEIPLSRTYISNF